MNINFNNLTIENIDKQEKLLIKEFDKSKGLDNTPLKKYYNYKPYKKSEIIVGYFSPIVWLKLFAKTSFPENVNRYFFNTLELQRLKQTYQKENFNFLLFILAFIGQNIGLAPIKLNITIIHFWLINFFGFWFVIISEYFNFGFTNSYLYLFLLYTLFAHFIAHTFHVYWKTREDNKVELLKLKFRSTYLEDRLSSTIVSYFRGNLIFSFIIKWLFLNNLILLTGTNLESIWSWFFLTFDNMAMIMTIFDILSKTFSQGLSDIVATSIIAKILFIAMNLINIFVTIQTLNMLRKLLKIKTETII